MALASVFRVSERLLERALSDRDALDTDIQPCAVHHREHARKPPILLADKKASRAARIAINTRASGRGMDAEVVLQRGAMDIVARAKRTIGVDKKLRQVKERDSARPFGCVGQPRQNEMHDIIGQIMLAIGDEDLGAKEFVSSILLTLGPGLERPQVGARL